MPDKYTMDGFGRKIKAKYPQYKDIPDAELAQKVIAKYPQYQDSILKAPPRIPPEARTVGNYASEGVRGVGRGLASIPAGIAQTVRHPSATFFGLGEQAGNAAMAAGKEFSSTAGQPVGRRLGAATLTGLEQAPLIGGMVQHAEQGGERMGSPEAFGAAVEGITSFEAPHLIPPALRLARRVGETGIKAAAGAGLGPVKELAKRTGTDNAAEIVRVADERRGTLAANKVADEKTLLERGKVEEHNAGLAGKDAVGQSEADQTRAQVARRGEAQKELEGISSRMDVAVEKARHDALDIGNKKYSGVNATLSHIPADMEQVHGLYGEAAESLGEAQAKPALLTRLGKALEKGEQFTYADEQALYSDLGKELSKGNLPGNLYHAYDALHEGIGDDMQRIADSRGQGAALTDARTYWRRMKQTFGKSSDMVNNRASKAVNAADPRILKRQANEYQIRLLSSFDPKIGELASRANALRQEVSSLPKKESSSAPAPRKDYSEPYANKAVERPTLKKIDARDIEAAKSGGMEKRAKQIRHAGVYAAVWPLFYVVKSAMAGHAQNLAADAAMAGGTALAGHAMASVLENPTVVKFLTKATPRDVEAIPQDLRGNLPQIVKSAKSRGIKVSDAVVRASQASIFLGARHPTDAYQNAHP